MPRLQGRISSIIVLCRARVIPALLPRTIYLVGSQLNPYTHELQAPRGPEVGRYARSYPSQKPANETHWLEGVSNCGSPGICLVFDEL